MQTLKYDDLPQGDFAGLLERQFVTDQKVFGARKHPAAFNGLENFVYLADANFQPNGTTGMHGHKEIDVISVMVDGNISHAGSLEHGQSLSAGMSQVQRAGAEGFRHDEINPDTTPNHMIQLWVLPDEAGEPAGYQVFEPVIGKRVQIYGGDKSQKERFYSRTAIDVANLEAGQSLEQTGNAMVFLSKGGGVINGQTIQARTLVRDASIHFVANADSQVIIIYPA
ncbi:pilus assembly protein [Marinomonas sp. SBI22]|uniref:pirin family protein n=1 Tax=unclassified Marinomonas TaxID=196814 RepID=UPI0007AF1AD8|nr:MULTISPECIES: pirin family protein [unclassified Marinomonas]KZM38907.1 pilus assembly protein [Marinomonas sp. SBI8L]KZM44837.1 pilus assembly protein [Marinomonas sp. SBI22]